MTADRRRKKVATIRRLSKAFCFSPVADGTRVFYGLAGDMTTSAKRTARHQAVITIVLVVAGMVLAACLFAAGLLWRGKPLRKEALTGKSETSCSIPGNEMKEEKCKSQQIANGLFLRCATRQGA